MANTLFLRLEGPMQSWGERARWSIRDTAPEPTKSGVVGLLACALGLGADADEEIRDLARALRIGVRCDRPGSPVVDYHTIGGGYERPVLLTAEGKPKRSSGRPHTEQTWRSYLCDASFLVAVQAAPTLIERLASAVQAPVWPYYLGRKCCVPVLPIFEGVGDHASLEAALAARKGPLRLGEKAREMRARAVVECSPGEAGVRRRDEIVSRSRRTFGPRYTADVLLTIHTSEEAQ